MEFRKAASCGRMIRARKFATAPDLAAEIARTLAVEAGVPGNRALMLAGGTTPLASYRLLAGSKPEIAEGARFFFSDDRHVPPDDPRSNAGQILPLLREAGVAASHVLRVHGEEPLDAATSRYALDLQALLDSGATLPFGLLGLGSDGHSASLFSSDDLARAGSALTVSVARPDGMNGVSVTPSILRRIERLVVAVQGADKRAIAERFVRQTLTTTAGRALEGHPRVELWTDADAWPL